MSSYNLNQIIYYLKLSYEYIKKKMTKKNRDYYFNMAINYVKEYVKKKDGIEWTGQDRPRYHAYPKK